MRADYIITADVEQRLITMRTVDDRAIREHASVRFRSDYHYAVFEYWRSAKVLAYLENAGVHTLNRVLDDGCGGGGMAVSFAEEARSVIGIEPGDRFRDAGSRLAGEKGVHNIVFATADGMALPFSDGSFDLVLSHSVIEHVADPRKYLNEAFRVLRPGGHMLLQTAPYLSPSGAHLPRLKIPIPIHLLMGRRAAFSLCRSLGKHAPQWLDVDPEGNSFVTTARRGETKADDLLYLATIRNLRANIAAAGFTTIKEDLAVSRLLARHLPRAVCALVPKLPFFGNIFVTNMEYVLEKAAGRRKSEGGRSG